jgi:hypothetical protein
MNRHGTVFRCLRATWSRPWRPRGARDPGADLGGLPQPRAASAALRQRDEPRETRQTPNRDSREIPGRDRRPQPRELDGEASVLSSSGQTTVSPLQVLRVATPPILRDQGRAPPPSPARFDRSQPRSADR